MAPLLDALSSTKYDDQRIARTFQKVVSIKLEMLAILDMMLRLAYVPPYVIAIFTDHSNYIRFPTFQKISRGNEIMESDF